MLTSLQIFKFSAQHCKDGVIFSFIWVSKCPQFSLVLGHQNINNTLNQKLHKIKVKSTRRPNITGTGWFAQLFRVSKCPKYSLMLGFQNINNTLDYKLHKIKVKSTTCLKVFTTIYSLWYQHVTYMNRT